MFMQNLKKRMFKKPLLAIYFSFLLRASDGLTRY